MGAPELVGGITMNIYTFLAYLFFAPIALGAGLSIAYWVMVVARVIRKPISDWITVSVRIIRRANKSE